MHLKNVQQLFMMDGDFIILHSIGFDKVLLISRMRSFRIVANAGSGQQQNVQVNYNNFIILLFKDHGCPDTGHKNGSALLKAVRFSVFGNNNELSLWNASFKHGRFFVFHFRSESIKVLKNIKCPIKPFEVCNVSG